MCELRSTDCGGYKSFVAGFIRGLTERLDRLAELGQHRAIPKGGWKHEAATS